tara:strand:+ start:1792 stop:2922 length:1131 start_codon:yes stop_codon:yes gene_type:complete
MDTTPVFKPLIESEELDAVRRSLEVGWLGMGKSVGEFEEALSEFLGLNDRFVVALSTGHAALHLAILTCNFNRDDEIITPSFNNVADFQAIIASGCQPVFCDIEEKSLCIDPNKIERLIGPKTKAIIVMDYFCNIANHQEIEKIATRYNLRVIHDAAHSFGSSYNGQKIGSFSDVAMFSFDPVKTITCIDGGALIVQTEKELNALREMRLIGMNQSVNSMYQNQRAWSYDVSKVGFRYHMSNPHASMGISQLSKMDFITESRRSSCKRYSELLRNLNPVVLPETNFKEVVPFLYYIRVDSKNRDKLRAHLLENGIDTGVHWQPGHHFSLFSGCRTGDLSVTDKIASEIISLPLHSGMDLLTIDYVCKKISEFFDSK